MCDTTSWDLTPVDFAANAASLGPTVFGAGARAELEAAQRAARRVTDRPAVIVVETDPEPGVPAYDSWWDVPIAEVFYSERVRAARRQHEEDLQRERRFP